MRRFLAWSLIVIGVVVMLAGAVALVDPVGTQMADDGDPFGPPPARTESVLMLALGLGTSVVGRMIKNR